MYPLKMNPMMAPINSKTAVPMHTLEIVLADDFMESWRCDLQPILKAASWLQWLMFGLQHDFGIMSKL